MRKRFYISGLLTLASFTALGQQGNIPVMDRAPMKVLKPYTTEVIDEAPAGETVTGLSRDGWSCHFKNGNVNIENVEGALGEYVIGEDGKIYLRYACASISYYLDTYLMLEPVDETTYVAHTPQLIWLEENEDGSLFTAYATRLVHEKRGSNSYTYSLDTEGDDANTDIFFTLENGALIQKDQETIEMNGELMPHELIGFTTSTGGWIGFGDGLVTLSRPGEAITALPEGAVAKDMSISFSTLYFSGDRCDDALPTKGAEVGDDLYLLTPGVKEETWIKGKIDRDKGTVTFPTQYLGPNPALNCVTWLRPATFEDIEEPWIEGSDYMEWHSKYTPSEALVFSYADGQLTSEGNQALYISRAADSLVPVTSYDSPAVKNREGASGTPVAPVILKHSWDGDLFEIGRIVFTIPRMDTEGICIPEDELYYNMYVRGEETPYVFTKDAYPNMETDNITDVPYGFTVAREKDYDLVNDIYHDGIFHGVYFYEDLGNIGIQIIRKHDGAETRSDITWLNGRPGTVDNVTDNGATAKRDGKYIENGNLVIYRDGRKYSSQGLPIE